jgi:hypothetical protein
VSGSLNIYSLAERAEWANIRTREYPTDYVQPCVDIQIPLEILLAKMQMVLTSMQFQWFHPDDLTLLARHFEDEMYLIVRVQHETLDCFQMNLSFTQATTQTVQTVLDHVRMALVPQ